MNKIIAIANQKGGVGKTTTSVNLSACIAAKGYKVLLIDIDPQGNATSGLGINKKSVNTSIYDVLVNDEHVDKSILQTNFENLYICPANMNLAAAEIELVTLISREYRLKNAFEQMKQSFDYIIIDCPPSLGLLTLNAFTSADSVLVPIQCEYYALEGLTHLTNTIKQVKKYLNKELDIEGVLLTMYDARTNLAIQVVEEVKKYFPKKVYKTIIPRNVRLSEAPSYGEPIIAYDSKSKGAESYMDLADEVIENTTMDNEE